MPLQSLLWLALLSALLSAAVTGAGLRSRLGRAWLDMPNARSLHQHPVPRIGGWGILAALVPALGMAAFMPTGGPDTLHGGLHVPLTGALGGALTGVAGVSLLDDRHGIAFGWRLLVHLLAAMLALGALLALPGMHPAPLLLIAICVLLVAWSTNLYNFMDGSDALAGLMGVIGFGGLSVALLLDMPAPMPMMTSAPGTGSAPWLAGWMAAGPFAPSHGPHLDGALAAGLRSTMMPITLAAAGACAGFLWWNRPPARVFMGDAGSTPLGFLAGALGVTGALGGLWGPALPASLFLPFLFDASVTLVWRALRGQRIWQAHREHAYQRLNMLGFGHARTALTYGLLMLGSAAVGLLALQCGPETQWMALGLLVGLHAVLYAAVMIWWRRFEARQARVS